MTPAMLRQRATRNVASIVLVVALFPGLAPAVADAEDKPTTPTIEVVPEVLTPYTSGGCVTPYAHCYRVRGTADPGARVTVRITDEVNPGFEVTAVTFAARRDDPGAGISAGDWLASPNVTDLGTHELAPSSLTFKAVAEIDGVPSDAASTVALKEASTPGDATPPEITDQEWPPANWCHVGVGLGCTCLFTLSCSQPARIRGRVEDYTAEAFGLASEIADVRITISRDDVVVKELRSYSRRGTTAFYDAWIYIEDYEAGRYTVTVSAIDALGHQADELSRSFTVHPL